MKVVIIGGGIAGLTAAILFQIKNWTVVVNEKSSSIANRGFAFLMSSDGLSILNEFMASADIQLNRQSVNLFSLKRPNNDEVIKIQLDGWSCMKRIDLITFLYSFFTKDTLKEGRSFSHFIYENNNAVAAVFENGEIEYGDLFIGADGSNSKVRELLFGKVNFTAIEVKEIVGVSHKPWNNDNKDVLFQKIQSTQKGLAFGYIPVAKNEVVWFMQFDVKLEVGIDEKNPESVKTFCLDMLKDFPIEVKEILEANDFSETYFWNTRDFDVLPSFHKNNIAIIGDAAHLALPFTSAGTTNAVLDAKALFESFELYPDYQNAFDYFYKTRSPSLKSHLEQGRELKKLFLNPASYSERGFILPLVSDRKNSENLKESKPIKILYFTDPVCSTCWIIQPILRKLKLEYDEYIDIEYKMGGLLPSWKDYNKGAIKQPSDAAQHWEDISISHKTPVVGDVWIEDPLDSSFPPSIAFKAAQLQNLNKATLFLRRLKELVFIEKQNITRWELIERAALNSGLDSALLLKDIPGKGKDLFLDDLRLCEKLDVKVFPTLFFSIGDGEKFVLKGYHTYEKFEAIIKQLIPEIKKKNNKPTPEELFTEFNNMTETEFMFLSDLKNEEGKAILIQLYESGKIEKFENKNGVIWMNKIV